MAAIMPISYLFIYSFDEIIKMYTIILIYILLTNEKPLKINECTRQIFDNRKCVLFLFQLNALHFFVLSNSNLNCKS